MSSVSRIPRLLLDLEDYERITGHPWKPIYYPHLVSPGFKKQPIPQLLRSRVFARDDFKCKKCGATERLSVDHIIPESKGGTLDMDNLQTLCKPCNSRKGARLDG
jgi:5-methylcytosine-specific restriction endonuclease McrA